MNMATKMRGKWKVGDAIGEGGQSNVYKTRDSNNKLFAIKIAKIQGGDKKRIQRIKQEIELIKKLKDSPNVINIYDDNSRELDDGSTDSQEVYYVMDYAPYGSLKHNDFYLNDIETSLSLFKEVLNGISDAHKAGIIHRDIKPENILLYPTQKTVAVADFGLGRLTTDDTTLTEADEILGPRFFMAPEQYKKPSSANERSDIYSLGKLLYFMLTGKGKVFREEIGDLAKDFQGSNPYLPLIQERLIEKMVVTDPAQRYSDVTEVLEVVDDILNTISTNSKRLIKKDSDRISFYDLVIGGRRQEFINNFSKDLAASIGYLGIIAEELARDKKHVLLEKLKLELLEKYSSGKVNAAIHATFMYVESPEELSSKAGGRYSFASYHLARYFENADTHEEAHAHIIDAISKEKDLSLQLRYLLLFSTICTNCQCPLPHDFDQKLISLFQSTDDKDIKARMYKMLGEHYKKRGDVAQGLRFMEAYLSIKPYDNDVRFSTAWDYSELGHTQLTVHHYNLHEKTSKEPSEDVENNLGVLYNNKNLDLMSMENYKKAYSKGSTLAGSNIASRYISIGLVDDAEKILRKIISEHPEGDYDQHVDEVLGSIANKKKAEKETIETMQTIGAAINQHNIDTIKSLSEPIIDWEGYWALDLGPIIHISRTGSTLNAKQRSNESKLAKLNFEGNIATIEKLEISYTMYEKGIFYIVEQNEFHGYVLKDDQYKKVIGKRIEDIKAHDEANVTSLQKIIDSYKKP